MRRIEYQRRVRSVPFQARDSADAVLVLAQIVRERRRLEQERTTLMRRIHRIEVRLNEIGATETRIVPTIKVASESSAEVKVGRSPNPIRPQTLPAGFTEFTVQY